MSFEVAAAKDYPGDGYDLVAMFDCLHDMGDPVDAAAHMLQLQNVDARGLSSSRARATGSRTT